MSPPGAERSGGELIVAPFSNCEIRDWPIERFAALIGQLLDRLPASGRITVIGTANQRLRANEIVRAFPADRVTNDCGRLSWIEVMGRLASASCVIGNNSGVTHLSARCGTPTVCVFGGSQPRGEWHPRGPRVMVISRAIGCSPCALDHGRVSPYDRACLRQIDAGTVAEAVLTLLADDGFGPASGGALPRRTHGFPAADAVHEGMA